MRQKLWDVLYPLVFFLLCMVTATILMLIVGSLLTGVQGLDAAQLAERIPGFYLWINVGFYSAALILQRKNVQRDNLRLEPFAPQWSLWKLLAAAAVGAALAWLLNLLIDVSGLQEIFPGYENSARLAFVDQPLPLLILAAVILAPLAEELIFRCMIYRRARAYLGNGGALAVSSLLFGLYHANVIQFLYAAALGLYFGWIYEKSRDLRAPIAAHLAANLLSVLLS